MVDVRLYCGDCLDILPTIEPGSVQAAIMDPPYGIGKSNIVPFKRTERNSKGRVIADFDWDEERKPVEVAAAVKVAKIAVVWGGNYYTDVLPVSRCWLVWDKQNSGNFSDFEMAWTNKDGAAKMFRYMWNGMIKQKPEPRYHPTQKPLDLMTWCVLNFTKPGETVLDPFMGSGTTGEACIKTGRNFIGIEKRPDYFAIAQKRIAAAQQQQPLFTEV